MADSLRYLNNHLLICNNALSLSCCDSQPEDAYWAAIPCGAAFNPKIWCDDPEYCVFDDRKYLSVFSACEGTPVKICESQRFWIDKYDKISDGVVNNAVIIRLDVAATQIGTIWWGDSSVSVTDQNGTENISTTGTLLDILTLIDARPLWNLGSPDTLIADGLVGTIVATGTRLFPPGGERTFDTKTSAIKLGFGGNVTPYINFDPNHLIFAANIEAGLNSLPGLSAQMEVTYNNQYIRSMSNEEYFEIFFSGSNVCGIPTGNITVDTMHLAFDDGFLGDTGFHYGDRTLSWLNEDDYLIEGTGGLGDYAALCPSEKLYWASITDPAAGPFPYNNVRCVPQRGATLGPNQNLFGAEVVDHGGYLQTNNFNNLESTILINDTCHTVNPFFFLYGKTGRFDYDPTSTQTAYRTPNCNYTLGRSVAGGCTGLVPENCSIELFLPMFGVNVPWGPFGSYFNGIEDISHPAIDIPDTYIGDNFPTRRGWDYRPKANIKTKGTWLETKTIEIYATIRRFVPFYIGEPEGDDLNLYAIVDPTTVDPSLVGYEGNGCGPISYSFDCEGKTIGEFVDAVNALRLRREDFDESVAICPLFNFCLAAENVRDLPAGIIINVASELFDLAINDGGYSPSNGSDNPDSDTLKYSGSDILFPQAYRDLWYPLGANVNLTPNPPVDVSDSDKVAKLPPDGRHRVWDIPRDYTYINGGAFFKSKTSSFLGDFRPKSPWWKAINAKYETIVTLSSRDQPVWLTKLDVGVEDRMINIAVSSGVTETVVWSSGINTNRGGAEYKAVTCAADINALSITVGDDTFSPLTAATGQRPYDIWWDDSTYRDIATQEPALMGAGGSEATTYNWSYIEPLLNVDTKNLLSEGALDLSSYVRRRTEIYDVVLNDLLYPTLSGCVPPAAVKYADDTRFDCAGDTIRDSNNYILTYGCQGYVCKTEWFLKSSRCGCATEYSCITRGAVAHRYNRTGDDIANENADGYAINQPDVYICESNFHHQCDIPFLIKPPFQIMAEGLGTLGSTRFGDCGQSTIDILYSDGTNDSDDANFIGNVVCDSAHTPEIYQFSQKAFLSDCVGWCQYIDPVTAERVRREDIPRTWPPTAYVVERGYPVYCSVNLYPDSLDTVCNNGVPDITVPWDQIGGVFPYVPGEYYNFLLDVPCMFASPTDSLRILTRPIVNPLTIGGLCGISDPTRIDINCQTKCCGCEFQCNPANGGVIENGPYTCPCFRTTTLIDSYSITNVAFICCATTEVSGDGVCNIGACEPVAGGPTFPGRYGGTYDQGYETSIVYVQNTCCGCDEMDISGGITYSLNRGAIDCDVDIGAIHFFDCCEGSAAWPPGSLCNVGSANPGGGGAVCNGLPEDTVNCSNIDNFIAIRSPATTYSLGCGNHQDCTYHRVYDNLEIDIDTTLTQGLCGTVVNEWNNVITSIRTGISLCDGAALGWSKSGDGSDTINANQVESQVGSINIGLETCAVCPVDQYADAQTLGYITGWLSNIAWVCGEPSLLATSSTGIYSPYC